MRIRAAWGWMLALSMFAVLTACSAEPDFDERYSAAQKKIDKTAKRIDKELQAREREAAQAGNTLPPESAAPTLR